MPYASGVGGMLGVNSTRTDLLVASVSSLKKTSVTKVPCRSTRREHTDGVADYSTGFGASALVYGQISLRRCCS